MSKKVTLNDIAQLAGVSKNTVSVVLRDLPGISDAVRQRVLEASEQLHYSRKPAVPDSKENYILVLMRRNFSGQVTAGYAAVGFIPRLYFALQSEAQKHGCTVVMQCVEEKDETECIPPSILKAMQFRGIVTLGNMSVGYVKALNMCGVRLVTLHQYYEALNAFAVVSDDMYAGYVMTKYLIDMGHSEIAYMGEKYYMSKYMERWLGYCRAMLENGLVPKDNIYSSAMVDRQQEDVERGLIAETFEKFETLPTAIVCGEDFTANRVRNHMMEIGKSVPDDISLVGFDDVYGESGSDEVLIVDARPMNVTTFHNDDKEMVKVAINMLLEVDEIAPYRAVTYGRPVYFDSVKNIRSADETIAKSSAHK